MVGFVGDAVADTVDDFREKGRRSDAEVGWLVGWRQFAVQNRSRWD